MNGYYSNLIEGYNTRPADIDAALSGDFSGDAKTKDLRLLHAAHLDVQTLLEKRVQEMPPEEIGSVDFLCWIHEVFFQRLPDSLRRVEGKDGEWREVIPGQLRDGVVSVGRHLVPEPAALSEFLDRFASFYGPLISTHPDSAIAAAAAHHRLTWIHPFDDSNGRVARLFSHAWMIKAGLDGGGLWTSARGLARSPEDYKQALANADQPKWNDLDGRGAPSLHGLTEFCEFFLSRAVDQMEFMHELLGLEDMQRRIVGYAQREEDVKSLPKGSSEILRALFLRGEITRGEIWGILNSSERKGRMVLGELLKKGLVTSPSAKGRLRLGFPTDAASFYFPRLVPSD